MTRDLSSLAIHTQTNRPWDLRTCCERYARAGIGGVSVWRHLLDPVRGGLKPAEAARVIADNGLRVPALVRTGFFVSPTVSARRAAVADAFAAIDEASTIGAESVVLVLGAHPEVPLVHAREMALEAIDEVALEAEHAGLRLAIEPLHPMYAADRSCVNSLASANDVCARLGRRCAGVVIDAYHVWWEPDLDEHIAEAGRAGRIFGLHLCDWRTPMRDPLNDRGLMGDGCIDLRGLMATIAAAGFAGWHEVEVFSEEYWSRDQDEYLELIIDRYCGLRASP